MTRDVAVDFFCGAGGMTNGLIRAGFHVLAGVDNEPLCRETYLQNRNQDGSRPEFLRHDIHVRSRIYPEGEQHLIAERLDGLLRAHKRVSGVRALRLIFAICAPCQPFTNITQIKLSDGRKFKRDNDANLLLTTVHLIKRYRPLAIVCENVEGIDRGEKAVLEKFRRRLARIGYGFDAKVVNAADFGVPQNRRRTIVIAFDQSRGDFEFEVLQADPRLKRRVSVAEAIGHLPPLAAGEIHPTLPNHRARALSALNLKRIACAPPGASNAYLRDTPYGDLSLGCHQRLNKRTGKWSFSDTYTRMRGDDVAPTITTKCMAISNGRFGHFDIAQNRAVSQHEAALLQTFPKRFRFIPESNIEFTSVLIGNAVPPKLATFFGRYVKTKLQAYRVGSAR